MPDKPLTVLTYAASASLAAVALIYFFNPNYLIDGDSSTSSASTRKKGIVGLFNPANDCFINSVLQSLAGLGDLRLYLIRELHRRQLGGPEVYAAVPFVDKNGKAVDGRKMASLQSGEVTQGLKIMLDKLNERPISKKTISATEFVRVLESAFATRISKSQQDAQELLQIVAERLSEEYHAGRGARKRARKLHEDTESGEEITHTETGKTDEEDDLKALLDAGPPPLTADTFGTSESEAENGEGDLLKEEGFPLEGQTEARTECQHCHFVPKAKPTSFVMLNLMVPQKISATLNECFDAHFKREFIDDYKCDKCRLDHAVEVFSKDLARASFPQHREHVEEKISRIHDALATDPEIAPEGVELPDSSLAPKRQIARHVEITSFPKVLVIHLSRSMFDPRSSSTKNLARVSFPERLPLGTLMNRRHYKLLGMVAHRGTHNSGHYETFRRQHFYAPTSTPHTDRSSGPYSTTTTPAQSRPKLPTSPKPSQNTTTTTKSQTTAALTTPSNHTPTSSSSSNTQSTPSTRPSSGEILDPKSSTDQPSSAQRPQSQASRPKSSSKSISMMDVARFKRKKRPVVDRWWRISDDKIKECKTADVLAMQKEVYLLFYEMEKDNGEG